MRTKELFLNPKNIFFGQVTVTRIFQLVLVQMFRLLKQLPTRMPWQLLEEMTGLLPIVLDGEILIVVRFCIVKKNLFLKIYLIMKALAESMAKTQMTTVRISRCKSQPQEKKTRKRKRRLPIRRKFILIKFKSRNFFRIPFRPNMRNILSFIMEPRKTWICWVGNCMMLPNLGSILLRRAQFCRPRNIWRFSKKILVLRSTILALKV